MRKTLITIAVIFGILAIGAGVYFAWQKASQQAGGDPNQSGNPPQNSGDPSNLPVSLSAINAKIKLLSKEDVLIYWVGNPYNSSENHDIFYISSAGNVNKISEDKEETISNENIGRAQFASLLAGGNKALIQYKQGDFLILKIFDFEKKIWQAVSGEDLPITSADLSPDGKKIAYLTYNQGKGVDLFTLDLSNEKAKPVKLATLNLRDFDIRWVNNDSILFTSKPSFEYFSEAWNFNIKTKVLSRISEGRGLLLNWSKFGDLGLKFWAIPDKKYSLTLVDGSGNTKGSFKFITFPDKCFISSSSQIYCAISRDQGIFSANATFPDDYLKRGVYFKDGIYQIDMNQNKFQALFESENPLIDAVNLSLAGNKLLFINRYDNKLYSLDI